MGTVIKRTIPIQEEGDFEGGKNKAVTPLFMKTKSPSSVWRTGKLC
jgi:hypothetical protein